MTSLPTMTGWPRRTASRLACIAVLIAAWAGASVVGAATQRAPEPQPPAKEPNSKLVKDENGRPVMEIRWPRGGGPVVRMRVPMELIWMGGLGGAGLVGPDYQDPDVVGPHQSILILEALVPGFEARSPENENRFKEGFAGSVVRMNIRGTSEIGITGTPIVDFIFSKHLGMILTPWAQSRYHLRLVEKESRFDLKRKGPAGNFERFREFGNVDDIYFPDESPKSRFMVCGAEEIKDISEDSAWKNRPICQHHYYSHTIGGLVILTYRRIYLPEWRRLEVAADDLFRTFEYRPVDQ